MKSKNKKKRMVKKNDLVHGHFGHTKVQNKPRTLVRGKTQGLFDFNKEQESLRNRLREIEGIENKGEETPKISEPEEIPKISEPEEKPFLSKLIPHEKEKPFLQKMTRHGKEKPFLRKGLFDEKKEQPFFSL